MAEQTRQPSSQAQGSATDRLAAIIATFAADADVGTATDPRIILHCRKKTRVYAATAFSRGVPVGIDASNTTAFFVYALDAAGAVSGAIFSKTLVAVPTSIGKLLKPVDLGNPVATYWDIPAGGGVGIFIQQVGAAADFSQGQNVEIYLTTAPGDDASIIGN